MLRALVLVLLALLLTSCRHDSPPPLKMICLASGTGGMDCHTSDGQNIYLAPSQTTNMWCAKQEDMESFMSWCYRAPRPLVESHMQDIKDEILYEQR
jgi:hypothetical protein